MLPMMVSVITIVSSAGWPLVVVSHVNEARWHRPGCRFSSVRFVFAGRHRAATGYWRFRNGRGGFEHGGRPKLPPRRNLARR
jgi:hypothetical protein